MPVEEDNLIGCENGDCNISWFHKKCMQIKNIPKSFPDCKKHNRNKKKIVPLIGIYFC